MHGLRVAVVGCGVGGLSAALCLQRFGHHPVLIDQTRELRPVGAGISLWPNGIKVLNLLGLGPRVRAIGGRMERMAYADSQGRILMDFPLGDLYDRVGERAFPLPRAALQDLLFNEVRAVLGPEAVSLGTRAERVSETDDQVVLTTGAGRVIEADAVVAADGTHSLLRDYVLGHHVERRYVGYVNWNGLVDESPDIAPLGTWLIWVGGGQRVSVMPVGGGQNYFFFDVPLPLDEVDRLPDHQTALAERFAGWPAGVQHLIERLDVARVARIPIHDVDPLTRWTRGRLALLGDAAHAMAPDLGQGGCQAMEDSWVLTHYLTSTNRSVPDALDRYQAERMPHTADIVRRARKRADTIHGVDPKVTGDWYRSLSTDGHRAILDGLAQSVETGPCR